MADYGVGGGRRDEYGKPVLPVVSAADSASVSTAGASGTVDLHRHPDDSGSVPLEDNEEGDGRRKQEPPPEEAEGIKLKPPGGQATQQSRPHLEAQAIVCRRVEARPERRQGNNGQDTR